MIESQIHLKDEREWHPFGQMRDNYPKYVLSLDFLMQSGSGICHCNIAELMSKNARL